jgi:hypothetical protein
MKGRELGNEEYEKFKDGLDRYAEMEGKDSNLVNIPTIVTGINEDGTIRQEITEPYAYEIIGRDKKITD